MLFAFVLGHIALTAASAAVVILRPEHMEQALAVALLFQSGGLTITLVMARSQRSISDASRHLLAACDALSNELADDAPYKMRLGGEEMLLTTPEDKVMTYNALIAALRLHDINVVEEA